MTDQALNSGANRQDNSDIRLIPMKDDAIHHLAFRELIRFEAKSHDTTFNEAGFPRLVKASQRGDIEVLFLMAGNEIAGGTVLFPSINVHYNSDTDGFEYLPAMHCEDMAIFEGFGGRGLGTQFLDDVVRFLNSKNGSGLAQTAIVGEHSKHAVKMLKMMGRLNTTFAPEDESILIFGRGGIRPKPQLIGFEAKTKLENLSFITSGPDPRVSTRNDVFIISWPPNRGRRIVAACTIGISTFTGDPVVRVQFKSNGVFPRTVELHCIIDEILKTAGVEILRRNWTEGRDPTSLFRLNATGESEIRDVLTNMGASARFLGPHSMHGHVIDFRNISKEVLANGCQGASMALSDVPVPLERLSTGFFDHGSGAVRSEPGRAAPTATL